MKHIQSPVLAIALGVAAFSQPAAAQTLTFEQDKVTASDGEAQALFGRCVDLDGNRMVVGAPGDAAGGLGAGAAYVFVQSGTQWSEEQKLTADFPDPGDQFGFSVALSGNTIAVGAYFDDDKAPDAGAVYVFTRSGSTWSQQAKLFGSDLLTNDYMGYALDLEGTRLAVLAPIADLGVGAVYIFEGSGSGWSQVDKLSGSPGDTLGFSVALAGNTIVTGSPFDDDNGADSGAAFVFEKSGAWGAQQKILPSDGSANSWFGHSVSVSGGTVVVGAPENPAASLRPGGAYVFDKSGGSWGQTQKLDASDGNVNELFGYSVSISGDELAVGALSAKGLALFEGAIYFFAKSGTWSQLGKLAASDGEPAEGLGCWVSLDGTLVAAGAEFDDDLGANSGSAYVFPAASSTAISFCTAGTSASGCQATLSAVGSASSTATSGFTVATANAEGSKFGLFYFGQNGRQANPWGNGTSFQCVVPPVKRGGLLGKTGTVGACDGAFSQDLNARWCPTCPKPNHNPTAGQKLQVQLWYRDPLNTSNQTTSLSDALEVDVVP